MLSLPRLVVRILLLSSLFSFSWIRFSPVNRDIFEYFEDCTGGKRDEKGRVRKTGHGEKGVCIERGRRGRIEGGIWSWNLAAPSSLPWNEARTGKTDVLYPVLERRPFQSKGGTRMKKVEGRRDALLVSGMDYGIGWNSGPESPPCLFQRDTSSFRHVRRGILPSYTVFRFFPGAVYGDLSHCLRFRVFHALPLLFLVQGSRGNSYSPAICFLYLPYVNPSCYVLDQTSSGYRKSKWNDRILLLLHAVQGNVYFHVVIQLERSSNF